MLEPTYTAEKAKHLRVMEAPSFVLLSLLLLLTCTTTSAQLSRGFYSKTCPNVEQLVRSAVTKKFQQTFVTAPATLRLFFHDCFVRVCSVALLHHFHGLACMVLVQMALSKSFSKQIICAQFCIQGPIQII